MRGKISHCSTFPPKGQQHAVKSNILLYDKQEIYPVLPWFLWSQSSSGDPYLHLSRARSEQCLPSVGWPGQWELKDMFGVCVFSSCSLQRLTRLLWESPGSLWKPHFISTRSSLIGSGAFGDQLSHKLFQKSGMTERWLSTNWKTYFLIQWWNTQTALSFRPWCWHMYLWPQHNCS